MRLLLALGLTLWSLTHVFWRRRHSVPFLLGAIAFQFAANALVSAKPRR
jgi:hypothetical protein